MRIITGTAKGCRLKAPGGGDTRPTADRIKESLFNILGPMVCGRKVLDLFAGTGSLGLEAISRGSLRSVFVDQATAAILRENISRTRFGEQSEIMGGDVFSAMRRLERAGRSFDLVFCDPPYHLGLWEKTLQFLDSSGLLEHKGILVVEQGADEEELPDLSSLVCVRRERYGHTTQIRFFQRREYVEGEN